MVENVQRRYTKRVPGMASLTYSERLHKLKLQSLEMRRLHYDLVQTFKIVRGFDSLRVSDFFEFFPESSRTRGHNFKLYPVKFQKDVRKYFFSNRVIACWNSLEADVVNSPSIDCFKQMLLRVDLNAYTKYNFE